MGQGPRTRARPAGIWKERQAPITTKRRKSSLALLSEPLLGKALAELIYEIALFARAVAHTCLYSFLPLITSTTFECLTVCLSLPLDTANSIRAATATATTKSGKCL